MYATLFFMLLGLLVTAPPLQADTFHVSTSGSDSASGSANAPFRTIARGLQAARSGDTVIVQGGTYAEGDLLPASGVTLQAAPGERPVIQPGRRIDTIIAFGNGVSHVTVDGFVLDGGGPGGERLVQFPVYTDKGNSHLTLQNSEVRNGSASCLLISGSYWEIRNNHIHHCGRDTTYDHGMYFSGDHSLIIGNRLDNNACFNIQNYGTYPSNYNVYEGNLLTRSGCGFVASTGHNITFKGNLMVDDGTQNPQRAMQAYVNNMQITGNTFVGVSLVTRGNSGIEIVDNIFCRGHIQAGYALLRGNRMTCEGLPALDRAPGGNGLGSVSRPPHPLTGEQTPIRGPLPAPRHLRVLRLP
jgi:hypothetical protein